jgi:TolB protein
VRSGPGLTYPAFNVLPQGDQVTVIGYDAAADWWQIQLADGITGWVSGGPAYVSVSDDPAGLSAATATEPSAPVANPALVSTLVFQTASGGPIYAIDEDGSNLRYLTTGLDPVLSPDGQWVTFTRWTSPQLGTLGSLWVINVDGTGERVILNNALQPRTPVWSPDGQQIAITVQHGGRVQDERTCGNLRPPREATDVSTSREGRRVVKYCYTLPPDPHWGLRLVNVATGEFEDLPHDIYSLSPAWDPANAWRLVYDGNKGLVNLDLNLGTRWLLTDDIRDHSPVFSPDGRSIAVSYWQHDHWDIHSLNADGSGRLRLTETPLRVIVQQELNGAAPQSWHNAAPVWSPDGTQIAFLTDRTGQWEIWVMSADGSQQRPLFPIEKLADITLQYNGVNERVLSWR